MDQKLKSLNDRVILLIDTISKLPGADELVNLKDIQARVREINQTVQNKKQELSDNALKQLSDNFNQRVDSQSPTRIPDANELKDRFRKQVDQYKQEIAKRLESYSSEDFINWLVPEPISLEEVWKLGSISFDYIFGMENSEAKKIVFNSDYFDLTGEIIIP